ncbi:MAG: hypothetical protein RIC34_17795 [Parvibaculum sp.]|uniref:hypothetical protein n=1 Tax=Parvibaculum sp. TaxID=2024848 RepID=UPI00328408A1
MAAVSAVSQKIQKSWISLLTLGAAADYIRLTNEGGAPLATKEFALVTGNQESRESDTQPGLKPQGRWPRQRACAVCSLTSEY